MSKKIEPKTLVTRPEPIFRSYNSSMAINRKMNMNKLKILLTWGYI